MSFFMLCALAAGLSMDAFAVSVSNGMCYQNIGKREAVLTAFIFGVFQGLMPVIGYLGGRLAEDLIASLDHWIALGLLCFIGGSMVLEGVNGEKGGEAAAPSRSLSAGILAVQGVATSIDALAVGVSLAALQTNITSAAALIAGITFADCLVGAALGRRFGILLGKKARILGGLVLIGIGLHIFGEHTLG